MNEPSAQEPVGGDGKAALPGRTRKKALAVVTSGTHAGLPRRVRQASLAPQLKESPLSRSHRPNALPTRYATCSPRSSGERNAPEKKPLRRGHD
ncbi:hypothetical protein ACFQYP_49975 [Nonomuraea antimicrobica]